jgi:hypothetical protein
MKPSDPRSHRLLDVRPILAQGGDPFQKIMSCVGELGPTEGLLLVTPFLPSPLIERLRAEGYVAHPVRSKDGSWRTLFTRD